MKLVKSHNNMGCGFTIVELLVVVVVIAVLAAITIVAYTNVSQNAVNSVLKADLRSASTQLSMFNAENDYYPATIDCDQDDSDTNKCIESDDGTTYTYKISPTNSRIFCLQADKNGSSYNLTQDGQISAGSCPVLNLDAGNKLSYPGTGTTWYDLSGNDNDGTILNGVEFDSDEGAMSFDGTDDYITVADSSTLKPTSITIAIRLYIVTNPNCDTNNNWRSLTRKSSAGAGTTNGFDIVLEEARYIAWDTGASGTSDRWWPNYSAIMSIGEWHYLAVVYDEVGEKSFYLDGSLAASKSVSALPLTYTDGSLLYISNSSVACPAGLGAFPGLIKSYRIYSEALNADEIKAIYEEAN